MDTSDAYPDVLGDALSHSSQRLAQLGSLLTAAATMEVRRRAQAQAADAARSERELGILRDQQRAAWQLARAGWAPAHDSRWLAQADLLQTARTWSAAAAYADAEPAAGAAMRKSEERLRVLHPYAMAWYDRLRSEGVGAVEAMRQAVPLFGRAPHPRPGDPAAERRGLTAPAGLDAEPRDDDAHRDGREPDADPGPGRKVEQRGYQIVHELQARAVAERGYALSSDELTTTLGAMTTLPGDVIARLARTDGQGLVAAGAERARADDPGYVPVAPSPAGDVIQGEQLAAASQDKLSVDTAGVHGSSQRTAAQLAAESFPCTAADGVMAAAAAGTRAGRPGIRTITTTSIRQPGRSL